MAKSTFARRRDELAALGVDRLADRVLILELANAALAWGMVEWCQAARDALRGDLRSLAERLKQYDDPASLVVRQEVAQLTLHQVAVTHELEPDADPIDEDVSEFVDEEVSEPVDEELSETSEEGSGENPDEDPDEDTDEDTDESPDEDTDEDTDGAGGLDDWPDHDSAA